MADNYTLFSELFEITSKKEEAWFIRHLTFKDEMLSSSEHVNEDGEPITSEARLFMRTAGEVGEEEYDFFWSIKRNPRGVWFKADESGSPYQVACVVHEFLKEFNSDRKFIVHFAFTCSKPRAGEFGGGMMVATKEGVGTCGDDEQYDHCLANLVRPWS